MQPHDLVPSEPRSWEPTALKIEPITSPRPSNRQLAEGVNQVHLCLEDHRQHTARELRGIKADMRKLTEALGVGEVKKKTVAMQTPRAAWWRTFIATASAITALGATLRLAEVLWPWLTGAAIALVHAMAAGRL